MGKSKTKRATIMNTIDAYWQAFCKREGLENNRYTEAFLGGTKTATCSSDPLDEWLRILIARFLKTFPYINNFFMLYID